jgi:hypothetical protein
MKQLFFLIFFYLVLSDAFSQLPEFEWATQCGNPPNSTDIKSAIVSCPDGCFYLAGEFVDTVQFGSKSMVSSGGTDIFIVKNNAEGEPLWSLKIGAADDEYVRNVCTDDEGNVIVTGYFYGTTRIGTDEYASYGGQDIFIAKYNAEGNFLWSFRAGGPMADYLSASAADSDQNIIISGYFYESVLFGDSTITASRGSDIFLAKFDDEGELLWVTAAGGSSSDQVSSAACDPDGHILLAGSYYYDITFSDTTLSTLNPVGVFIAKYLPDGQLEQVFQLDGTSLTTEILITDTPSGNYYISGSFSGQVTFGAKVFDAGEFNEDLYIAKYGGSGDLQWARHAFSTSSDQVAGLETDAYNNLYITGHYLDTIHFDQLTLPYTLCCGSREIFIVNYSADGDVLWSEQISGTRAKVQSIDLNQQDELLISGLFTEEMTLGQLSLSNYDGFRNYVTALHTQLYTSVKLPDGKTSMKVFPNPASDKLHILPDLPGNIYDYIITDYSGKAVGYGSLNPGGNVDISYLSAGTYILQLKLPGNNRSYHSVFLKK